MDNSTPQSEFWAGARGQIPILVGVTPFGIIYGALAVNAGLPVSLSQAMSSILFAGSAQFVAVPLYAEGATPLLMISTVFIINLRHLLYSTSVAPYMRHLNRRWKLLLAYLLTDEAYVVAIVRYRRKDETPHKHWYFFGTGLALWTTWQLSTAVGVFIGAGEIPPEWGLDFTLAVTFIAMLVPSLTDRPMLLAAVVGGAVAVLAHGLPNQLGLLLAVLAGIAAGMWAEAWLPPKTPKQPSDVKIEGGGS